MRTSLALLALGLLLGWLLVTLCHAGPVVNSHAAFLPNPGLTPGDALPVDAHTVCQPGYAQRVRAVPESVKRAVYLEYGMRVPLTGADEIDHLIPLEIGGSNSSKNLWPQPLGTQPWNAKVKDGLESELHREVCAGKLSLAQAQREIASDWIQCWQTHFHRLLP
jgi:hypothetical protein